MKTPEKSVEENFQHAYDSIVFNHNPVEADKQFGKLVESVLTKLVTQTLTAERQKREEVVEDRPTVEDCQKLVDDGCGEWATKEELEQGTNTDGKIYPTQ